MNRNSNSDLIETVTLSPDKIDTDNIEGFEPVGLYQKRERIFTRSVSGKYQKIRYLSGWPLLAGYFLTPWINWGERQAIWFDLPSREFHVFGLTFWPQDFWLLGWLLAISAFALFTVTTLVGRLWCGYTCPQTVWTAIFMWIEQKTEGPRHQRIRLAKGPWTFARIRKSAFKHLLWILVAFATGLAFVGYFVPIRSLALDLIVFDASLSVAFWVIFFTLATYANAGWLREQVCIYMCPYARFQSAMIDKDTLVVSYDAARGETRGARKRNQPSNDLGDCIDCQLCVQVCPTGIDIRNGLQYECIGCALCIDACAQIMNKMNYAPGLIRYTTERELSGEKTHWLRPKIIGYAVVLLAISAAFWIAIFTRLPFEIDVIRDRGALFHLENGDIVRNDFTLQLINMAQSETTLILTVTSEIPLLGETSFPVTIPQGEVLSVPVSLKTAKANFVQAVIPVQFNLCNPDTKACVKESSNLLGPLE